MYNTRGVAADKMSSSLPRRANENTLRLAAASERGTRGQGKGDMHILTREAGLHKKGPCCVELDENIAFADRPVRSLAPALSLDQRDSPPATAAHLLPLQFVACHPTRLYTPNRFPTSYCCSPAAFVSCHPTSLDQENFSPATAAHLLPLKFVSCHPTSLDQADSLTSCCCSFTPFVPCHSTSFGQADFSPATSAHLHPFRKFRQKTWNFESRKNARHATKLARIVAREMSLRGKVVAATRRLVCKGP